MKRQSAVGLAMAATVVALAGCARSDAPPGPDAPSLSLFGATGVTADVRRSVTQVGGGMEIILSVVDTTVWAPFDHRGVALVSSDEAGAPGPVGRKGTSDEREWTRHASFVDSAGVLHELWASGTGPGRLERMRYHRQGVALVEYSGTWVNVAGGSLLDRGAMTFHLEGLPSVRLDLVGRQVRVASAGPFTGLLAMGTAVTDLLRPQPLTAQLYLSECTKEWLTWGGAAIMAQVAWAKFLKTKSYKYFKLALAATGAAGVALDKLVDCMVEQSEQPEQP